MQRKGTSSSAIRYSTSSCNSTVAFPPTYTTALVAVPATAIRLGFVGVFYCQGDVQVRQLAKNLGVSRYGTNSILPSYMCLHQVEYVFQIVDFFLSFL